VDPLEAAVVADLVLEELEHAAHINAIKGKTDMINFTCLFAIFTD
jgi:hypothetical protein